MNTVIPILLIKLVYLGITMKVFESLPDGKNFEWNGKEVGTNTVVDNGHIYQFDRAVSLLFDVILLTRFSVAIRRKPCLSLGVVSRVYVKTSKNNQDGQLNVILSLFKCVDGLGF